MMDKSQKHSFEKCTLPLDIRDILIKTIVPFSSVGENIKLVRFYKTVEDAILINSYIATKLFDEEDSIKLNHKDRAVIKGKL